jgi:lipoprotein-releasing system ATP-binding protein
MSDPALALDAVERRFSQGNGSLHVLKGATLSIAPGEVVALIGPSGAGKSTLLHVAGLLERPDAGEVRLSGEACGALSDDRRTELRRRFLGFVYQFHHLLPEFSALENVVLPQMVAGKSRREAAKRADELLAAVGLAERTTHRPARLSGGEQQRVALARALANNPQLVLADEPTGNLDPRTATQVFDLLLSIARELRVAALIATHNPELARRMDRTLAIEDGRIVTA